MTVEELRTWIIAQERLAFTQCKSLVQGDVEPRFCGYKTIEDGVVKIVRNTTAQIEKEIRKFERENPFFTVHTFNARPK